MILFRKINVPKTIYIVAPWLPILLILVLAGNPTVVNIWLLVFVFCAACHGAVVISLRNVNNTPDSWI